MKWRFSVFSSVMLSVLILATAAVAGEPLPEGWMGGNTQNYEVGLDTEIFKEGKAAATIKSKTSTPENFGTIVQTFSAESYLGKRVRMSAFVKADKITNWAGLWMRVDGEGQDQVALSFDNMQNRPISGTQEWKKHEIVLDVPQEGKSITFGILLNGPGQAWVDGFAFEVVSKEVPVTGFAGHKVPVKPLNLGFE